MLRLVVESWIWYSFAMFVTVCRLVSRSLLFGSPLRIKIDDYLIVFAICTYTTLVVCMNIVADKSSNLIPPGVDVASFTPKEVKERVFGSKLVVVVEQMQCLTIWTLKATLLIMYYRLTYQLRQNLYVKILAAYVAITFVVMEILYLGVWCQPFHNYWAVPTPNKQCDAATDHLITNAVFNLSSDLGMLAIGFSLAARSKLPWKRRVIVHAIFALGIFVIVAAVLNKYYSFTQPYGSLWTFWYIREASTAMIVANLPYTWTLIRRVFNVGSFSGESDTSSGRPTATDKRASTTTSPSTSGGGAARGSTAGGLRSALASRVGSVFHIHIHHHDVASDDKRSSESHSGNELATAADGQGLRSGTCSPAPDDGKRASTTSGPLAVPTPAAMKRTTWRDKGVFGKEDAELFAAEHDADVDLEAQQEAARRRYSSIPMVDPHDVSAPEDMILNDAGALGSSLPTPEAAHQPSSYLGAEGQRNSGRQSPGSEPTLERELPVFSRRRPD